MPIQPDVWLTSWMLPLLSSKVSVLQHTLDLCSTWTFHCCPSMSPVALVQSHCFTGMINPRLHPTEVNGILSDGPSRQLNELFRPSLCTRLRCNLSALRSRSAHTGKKHETSQWRCRLPWFAEPFPKDVNNLMFFCFASFYAGCLHPTLLMLLVTMLSWAFLI